MAKFAGTEVFPKVELSVEYDTSADSSTYLNDNQVGYLFAISKSELSQRSNLTVVGDINRKIVPFF